MSNPLTNPLTLFTTARKALATGLAIAVSVEATGVVSGTAGHWLVQGITLATAVLGATLTYKVGNATEGPSVKQQTADGQSALLAQFTAVSPTAPTSVPVAPTVAAGTESAP